MAGYLKTPSKRSVARAKRPELPPSPEKRVVGLVRERERGVAASAPPATMGFVDRGNANGGITSFERRLREGGFGGGILNVGGGRGRGRGRRVGVGDLDGG
jgi:protein SFI1